LKSSNMEVLKDSMQAKGRAKVGDAVRRRTGKPAKEEATPRTLKTNTKLAPDGALRNSLMWRYDAGNKGEVRAY